MEDTAVFLIICFFWAAMFAVWVGVAVWAYRDAQRLGKSPILAAILVMCVGFIGLIIWLILRQQPNTVPITATPPQRTAPPSTTPDKPAAPKRYANPLPAQPFMADVTPPTPEPKEADERILELAEEARGLWLEFDEADILSMMDDNYSVARMADARRISENEVARLQGRLRHKLRVKDDAELLRVARKAGLI